MTISLVHESDRSGNALTVIDGRVGAGVTAVTIDRTGQEPVQATVANGWYLAWWPGAAAPSAAALTTSSGTTTQTIPAAPGLPCPAGAACSTGYSSGGGGGESSGYSSAGGGGGEETNSVRSS